MQSSRELQFKKSKNVQAKTYFTQMQQDKQYFQWFFLHKKKPFNDFLSG